MLGKSLVILLIFGLTAGLELPGIVKKKQWKQFFVYTVFFFFALTITVLHQLFEFEFYWISRWFVTVLNYQ